MNLSGKLPVTFPKSLDDVPAATRRPVARQNGTVQYSEGLDVGYRWYDAKNKTPLFPFGYGLSYTSFAFSRLRVAPLRDATRRPAAASRADVTNTGSRAGAEVAQLYVSDPASTGEPASSAQGLPEGRASAPGSPSAVTFDVHRPGRLVLERRRPDLAGRRRQLRPCMVGDSSQNLPLRARCASGPTAAGRVTPKVAAPSLTAVGTPSR